MALFHTEQHFYLGDFTGITCKLSQAKVKPSGRGARLLSQAVDRLYHFLCIFWDMVKQYKREKPGDTSLLEPYLFIPFQPKLSYSLNNHKYRQ
jgi:hypothetical protein